MSTAAGRKHLPKTKASIPILKWPDETRILIARYINEHFLTYKVLGESRGKKMDFLRKMRDSLRLQCTDKQLKNVFEKLIKKYREVRDQLNSSGFGLLTEETNINKGIILTKCPYFEILDEVMGYRANESTPYILSTVSMKNASADSPPHLNSDSMGCMLMATEVCSESDDFDCNNGEAICVAEYIEDVEDPPIPTAKLVTGEDPEDTTKLVTKTMPALGAKKRKEEIPKNALAAFAAIFSESNEVFKQVEEKKLKLENEKFTYAKLLDQIQLEDKKEERSFELEKIRIQGEIEIKKLQLQIDLEKIRGSQT